MYRAPSYPTADAPTIYLVERNGRQQTVIRDKLRKHGYQVLVAHNPQMAVDRYLDYGFDALVVDVSRTQDEGLEALHSIARAAKERDEVCHCIALLTPEQKEFAWYIQSSPALRSVVTLLYRPVRLLELLSTVKSLVPTPFDPRRPSHHSPYPVYRESTSPLFASS